MIRTVSGGNGHTFAAERLTARQRRAIPHLIAAASYEQGCGTAGIGRTTLTRWLHEPSFRAALRGAEAEAFRAAMRTVERATARAAETLEALLKSEEEGVRLRAATELLACAIKARDQIVTEDRLTDLEDRIKGGP